MKRKNRAIEFAEKDSGVGTYPGWNRAMEASTPSDHSIGYKRKEDGGANKKINKSSRSRSIPVTNYHIDSASIKKKKPTK